MLLARVAQAEIVHGVVVGSGGPIAGATVAPTRGDITLTDNDGKFTVDGDGELTVSAPGFVSYKDYASSDGESVTVVEFESHETLAAWRSHPEHVAAQELGRAKYFETYRISVADIVRDKTWPA